MSQKKFTLQDLQQSSFFDGDNANYLEALYEQYLQDPRSIDATMRAQFDALPGSLFPEVAHRPVQETFLQYAKHKQVRSGAVSVASPKLTQVLALVDAYRRLGHRQAKLDPLTLQASPTLPELTLAYYQLSQGDLTSTFAVNVAGIPQASLAEILERLQAIYCRNVGVEYMYISDEDERNWLMQRLEARLLNIAYADEKRKHILSLLNKAQGLEQYLHNRFVGQKRFSLEGGDSLIPCVDELIQQAGLNGVKEIMIGMAHRGRLNVLVNILGKAPGDLFQEFEGKAAKELVAGDVKYHQGFSSDIETPHGVLHLALAFNPSHLEIVSPVVEGSVKARQVRRDDYAHQQVLPILMH
ncbi:MAG TPA: 2-oxoglutarate dehydrogenase E1 component, partial [Gammaproteobacteria bacterium]|nr:2-oxoglutarate dehydrogenase E1 component [Gammaproteobacteria bacterium]